MYAIWFLVLIGIVLIMIISLKAVYAFTSPYTPEEEHHLYLRADQLRNICSDTERPSIAYEALTEFESMHDALVNESHLFTEDEYQRDLKEMREEYETLEKDKWKEKADKALDEFIDMYMFINDPDERDIEKAVHSKAKCISLWQSYFATIPGDTGIWYDAQGYMKEYLGDEYDPCMESHEALEKKLTQRVETLKPEYRRKMNLRKQIVDTVARHESIMRSELLAMPFEGCTNKEVAYCVRELVDAYRLVSLKIGNRYFISLSDNEKARREK